MNKNELASVILATSLLLTSAAASAAQGVVLAAGTELQLQPVKSSPPVQKDRTFPVQFVITNPELKGCRITMAAKWAPSDSRVYSSNDTAIQCNSWQVAVSGALIGNRKFGATLASDEHVAFLLDKSVMLPPLAGDETPLIKRD